MAKISFDPASLLSHLTPYLTANRWLVAFSGGVDSTVLLFALKQLAKTEPLPPLLAVHINHHISPDSELWAQQCGEFCRKYQIDFQCYDVSLNNIKNTGLEAAARVARYQQFEQLIADNECLLLGHHQNDQAETLLLQTLRGGGVHGLAAMPQSKPFANGTMLRPILQYSRSALRAYALEKQLSWIEDPSNQHTQYERNYIRHQLIPQLQQRRSGVVEVLSRSASHFAQSAHILDEVGKSDLSTIVADQNTVINIPRLLMLSIARQHNVIRYWIHQEGFQFPNSRWLEQLFHSVIPAAVDRTPVLELEYGEVRRFHQHLYLLPPIPTPPESMKLLQWQKTIKLPADLGNLAFKMVMGGGIAQHFLYNANVVEIVWRKGGEIIVLKDGHHHQLKKLFQQKSIPPWERDLIPLIQIDGELAQVASYWTDNKFRATTTEAGIEFQWWR